jgi:hypothetical protein
MKLRRILTGAAIGAATAIAFRSFVIWALPWQWDWHANGDLVRAFSAGSMRRRDVRRDLPSLQPRPGMSARVLIGCERSGVLRRAFLALGIDAWSCDLEPADDGSNRHIRGNLLDHLDDGWDLLAVMHPPCTRLCNSGVRWLYIGGRRANGHDRKAWADLRAAAAFYRACRERGNIPRRALENPVMHRHATALTARPRVRFVQPWWFGDPYFKSTGFELINLPPLVPTNKLVPPAPAPTNTRHGR